MPSPKSRMYDKRTSFVKETGSGTNLADEILADPGSHDATRIPQAPFLRLDGLFRDAVFFFPRLVPRASQEYLGLRMISLFLGGSQLGDLLIVGVPRASHE